MHERYYHLDVAPLKGCAELAWGRLAAEVRRVDPLYGAPKTMLYYWFHV